MILKTFIKVDQQLLANKFLSQYRKANAGHDWKWNIYEKNLRSMQQKDAWSKHIIAKLPTHIE